MLRKCGEEDRERLEAFLNEKPVYHTFLISDLDKYGFDKDFQTIYMQEEEGRCIGVFLKYFYNLIVAGEGQELDYEAVSRLADDKITTIMGRAEVVQNIAERVGGRLRMTYHNLYIHEEAERLEPVDNNVRFADLDDAGRIYEFLMGFPEMQNLYSEKKMIENRISNMEGVHAMIEKQGKIVAHGNSAASAERTCMLGGICVADEYRGRGYAKDIIRTLCGALHSQGKIPCMFAPENNPYTIFSELGFKIYGRWGVAQLI